MTRYLLLLISTLCMLPLFSQNKSSVNKGYIQGWVYEKSDKVPVVSATVKLMNSNDSSLVQAVLTNEKGFFRIDANFEKYILEIKYIAHHKETFNIHLSKKTPIHSVDTVYLKDDAILLGEAIVEAEILAMQVKGDTIEFNAGAYNIDGSSVLKDLIKQIHGLELDDKGNLKANGKAISKILVDGKEYFSSDISMALSTLPAGMITKLQLFEKESEEAKASGIRDSEPEQVLNLGVKEEFKRNIFGDTKSGMGNKGRHTNRANVNKMQGDNQFALVGNINNIDDSEYDMGIGQSKNLDDNISKSIGTNFNIQQSEKFTLNGSATYDNYKSRNEFRSDSYSSILNQYSKNSSNNVNRRQDMSLNANIDWRPDTLTTINFRTNTSYNIGDNTSASIDTAKIVDKSATFSSSKNYSESNAFSLNNSLLVVRQLNNKGRNITVNLSQSYSKDESDGTRYSEKIYLGTAPIDITDQLSKNDSKSTSYGLSARYVEPLGKDNKLHLTYAINFNDGERLGDVRKKDPLTGEHTILDTDYSRNTTSSSVRQKVKLGFQRRQEKYSLNVELSVDPSTTRNKIALMDSTLENLKQSVVNFTPAVYFSWQPDKNSHLDFSYFGSTNHPSITQLSADTVIVNSMQKNVGNPNLKPSFSNSFNLNYRRSDFESNRYFSASLGYNHSLNSTVSYKIVDEHSNSISTYRNVDGNSSAYTSVAYNTALKNKKINIGIMLSSFYNKNIGYINERKNTIQSVSLSPMFIGRFNSDIFEANLYISIDHNITHNNLSKKKQSNNTNYNLSNRLKIKLPLDFSIESGINYSHRTGLAENIRKNQTIWNLAASKLFLKDKRGTLKFEYYDVLNDMRNEENTVSGSDYRNSWAKTINTYFILSFSYRFNIIGG